MKKIERYSVHLNLTCVVLLVSFLSVTMLSHSKLANASSPYPSCNFGSSCYAGYLLSIEVDGVQANIRVPGAYYYNNGYPSWMFINMESPVSGPQPYEETGWVMQNGNLCGIGNSVIVYSAYIDKNGIAQFSCNLGYYPGLASNDNYAVQYDGDSSSSNYGYFVHTWNGAVVSKESLTTNAEDLYIDQYGNPMGFQKVTAFGQTTNPIANIGGPNPSDVVPVTTIGTKLNPTGGFRTLPYDVSPFNTSFFLGFPNPPFSSCPSGYYYNCPASVTLVNNFGYQEIDVWTNYH